MSGRTRLLDALGAGLDEADWLVSRAGTKADQDRRNAVYAFTDSVKRPPSQGKAIVTETMTLLILIRETRPEKLDDALDAALFEVVGVIEDDEVLSWEQADRTVIDDRFEGWTLTITAHYTITKE